MSYTSSLLFFPLFQEFGGAWTGASDDVRFGRPLFYEAGNSYREMCLLVSPEHLEECRENSRDCALIFNEPVDLTGLECPAYCPAAVVSILHLFNRLSAICDRLDRWQAGMDEIVRNMGTYDDLYRISDTVLTRGFSLFDTNFRFVSLSDKITSHQDLLTYIVSVNPTGEQVMPLDNLLEYTKSRAFSLHAASRGVFRIEDPRPSFNRNIFYDGARVGVASLEACGDPLEDAYNCAALTMLTDYVEKLYYYYRGFFMVHSGHVQMESALRAFLDDGGPVPEDLAAGAPLRLCLIENQKDISLEHYIIYFCNFLESWLQDCFCFALDGRVAVLLWQLRAGGAAVARGTALGGAPAAHGRSLEDRYRMLEEFLAGKDLRTGVSRDFALLNDLPAAICQAEAALSISRFSGTSRSARTSGVILFDDVALQYLLRKGMDQPDRVAVAKMTSPAIATLEEYDRTHNAELARTLCTYLKCNLGATESARALYIHRSTFLSRLERIAALTGLDLTDYETRLYLELSFALLELDRREQE